MPGWMNRTSTGTFQAPIGFKLRKQFTEILQLFWYPLAVWGGPFSFSACSAEKCSTEDYGAAKIEVGYFNCIALQDLRLCCLKCQYIQKQGAIRHARMQTHSLDDGKEVSYGGKKVTRRAGGTLNVKKLGERLVVALCLAGRTEAFKLSKQDWRRFIKEGLLFEWCLLPHKLRTWVGQSMWLWQKEKRRGSNMSCKLQPAGWNHHHFARGNLRRTFS